MQVYAVVVGALSAATSALYFIPFIIETGSIFVASWDAILFVLWITLFGVFGKVRSCSDQPPPSVCCTEPCPRKRKRDKRLKKTAVLLSFSQILTRQLAQLYIDENAHGNGNIERMKHAVWVDLTSALLWLIATVATLAYWWKHRNTRSVFTGRAKV